MLKGVSTLATKEKGRLPLHKQGSETGDPGVELGHHAPFRDHPGRPRSLVGVYENHDSFWGVSTRQLVFRDQHTGNDPRPLGVPAYKSVHQENSTIQETLCNYLSIRRPAIRNMLSCRVLVSTSLPACASVLAESMNCSTRRLVINSVMSFSSGMLWANESSFATWTFLFWRLREVSTEEMRPATFSLFTQKSASVTFSSCSWPRHVSASWTLLSLVITPLGPIPPSSSHEMYWRRALRLRRWSGLQASGLTKQRYFETSTQISLRCAMSLLPPTLLPRCPSRSLRNGSSRSNRGAFLVDFPHRVADDGPGRADGLLWLTVLDYRLSTRGRQYWTRGRLSWTRGRGCGSYSQLDF